MEEKGYKQLITLVFESLNNVLSNESWMEIRQICDSDEAHQKAEKLNNELESLLEEYGHVRRIVIDTDKFLTQDSIQKRDFIISRHNFYKKELNMKKEIINCQLEAHCDRAYEQQKILYGYGILEKEGNVAPVTISLLKSLLDLPDDTELFGGTDQ